MEPLHKLTPKQKLWIEARLANPKMSIAELSAQIGLSKNTIYDWKDAAPWVQEEIDRRLKVQWADAAAAAQEQMIKLSNEGNFNATKYILDSNGYMAPQKVELNTTADITINLTDEN